MASDLLLRLAGGPARVTAYVRGLGIRDMDIATSERQMSADPSRRTQYGNFSTPRAAVALLTALYRGPGLSNDARTLLLRHMTDSVPGAKRLKGLLPPGTIVAHKTGTDATVNGMTRATNDIGIVTLPNGRHMAIAVLLTQARGSDAARDSVIARASRAAYDALSSLP